MEAVATQSPTLARPKYCPKKCQRCLGPRGPGDLFLEPGTYGPEVVCLQCGWSVRYNEVGWKLD